MLFQKKERKKAADRAKAHYLLIVLVSPLLGFRPSMRINRAGIVAMESFTGSLWRKAHEGCFHFEAEADSPADAHMTSPLFIANEWQAVSASVSTHLKLRSTSSA